MHKKIIMLCGVIGASIYTSDNVFKKDAWELLDCLGKGDKRHREYCRQSIEERYMNDCKGILLAESLFSKSLRDACVIEKLKYLSHAVKTLQKEGSDLREKAREFVPDAPKASENE